jgi:hypothetical protein
MTAPSAIPMPWKWQVTMDLEITTLESTPDHPEGKTRVEAALDGNRLREFWIEEDVRLADAAALKIAIGVAVGEILEDELRDAS